MCATQHQDTDGPVIIWTSMQALAFALGAEPGETAFASAPTLSSRPAAHIARAIVDGGDDFPPDLRAYAQIVLDRIQVTL